MSEMGQSERERMYDFVRRLISAGEAYSLVSEVSESLSHIFLFKCERPVVFACTHLHVENPIEQTVQQDNTHVSLI